MAKGKLKKAVPTDKAEEADAGSTEKPELKDVVPRRKKMLKKVKNVEAQPVETNSDDSESETENNVDENEPMSLSTSKHKEHLEKIKQSDPEFFKFLQAEDADLLAFSGESEGEEGEDEKSGDEDTGIVGKRRPKLHTDKSSRRKLFDENWASYLNELFSTEEDKFPSLPSVKLAVEAFSACVARTGAEMKTPAWVINSEAVFDSVVRLCFSRMSEVILHHLGDLENVQESSESEAEDEEEPVGARAALPTGRLRFKNWKKCANVVKEYVQGLFKFVNEVVSPAVIVGGLKAVIPLVPVFSQISKLNRSLVKYLVRLWTRKTMDVRCMAYIVLRKIVEQDKAMYSTVYKHMYLGFVGNSRQVSGETWPLLQFMHRTFAELSLIDPQKAYQYAFVYIRQIAIHVRNAKIGNQRKDLVQSVYNWQMMQCLYLWGVVISRAHEVSGADALCELRYPLTQVVIATLQLFPSSRFLPLRCHCLQILIELQVNCNIYIPTLALGCDLLNDMKVLLRKKPKVTKASKDVDMDSCLRATAQQMDESSFRKAAIDTLFRIMLQSAHVLAFQPAFPDIVVPIEARLRQFVKEVGNPECARLFKALIEKLQQHMEYVRGILKTRSIDLDDDRSVMQASYMLTDPESPIPKYFAQFSHVWKLRAAAFAKAQNEMSERDKRREEAKAQDDEDSGSLSDDEMGDNEGVAVTEKPKPVKTLTKKQKKPVDGGRKKLKLEEIIPDETIGDTVMDLEKMTWSDDE